MVSSGMNMLRVSVEPDFPVWLTHEDIINNKDTVVGAAVEWIQNGGPPPVGVETPRMQPERPDNFPIEVYPNPFLDSISFSVPDGVPGPLTLELYDLLGRRVAQTTHHGLPPARLSTTNAPELHGLPSGPYLYRISSGSRVASGLIFRR